MDPYRRETWRAEARVRIAESRGWVPDRRPGVFEHSKHSVWLLWHLNSVWCLQHLSTPSIENANDKNDREGLHFLQNITHREKHSNINCAEWWIPAKRCRISIVTLVDLKQQVLDLRFGGISPNFNPCSGPIYWKGRGIKQHKAQHFICSPCSRAKSLRHTV